MSLYQTRTAKSEAHRSAVCYSLRLMQWQHEHVAYLTLPSHSSLRINDLLVSGRLLCLTLQCGPGEAVHVVAAALHGSTPHIPACQRHHMAGMHGRCDRTQPSRLHVSIPAHEAASRPSCTPSHASRVQAAV